MTRIAEPADLGLVAFRISPNCECDIQDVYHATTDIHFVYYATTPEKAWAKFCRLRFGALKPAREDWRIEQVNPLDRKSPN